MKRINTITALCNAYNLGVRGSDKSDVLRTIARDALVALTTDFRMNIDWHHDPSGLATPGRAALLGLDENSTTLCPAYKPTTKRERKG